MRSTNQVETTTVQSFNFAAGLALRSFVKDGQPWFIAKDVTDALGLSSRSRAVEGLDDDEKGVNIVHTPGGPQSLVTVSESGLYGLVMRSRKPAAKAFRRWVTSVVLPTLRRDGLYVAGQELPVPADQSLDDLMAQMADLQAKVDAVKEARMLAWARARAYRDERRDALRMLR